MHILLVSSAKLPALQYGGTERMILWLARGLTERGHRVTLLAPAGSRFEHGDGLPLNPERPLSEQVPAGVDVVHSHCGLDPDWDGPVCQTVHGNAKTPARYHPNTIFVSAHHAASHGANAYVHNGVDPRAYPAPDLDATGGPLVFLAKAAWKVKNIKGAVRVARKAHRPLSVLGGYRVNFKMGFRVTLDPNARFYGMVDDAEKARHLKPASGLLFPVRWHEPFGIAVIEALYFGLPVFATPYGALPELVPDFAGALSANGNDLVAAIKVIGDYDRRAIHRHFQENFTAERMTERYLALYERIANGERLHDGVIEGRAARGKVLLPWED